MTGQGVYGCSVAPLRSAWRWLGRRPRLSPAGRVAVIAVLLAGGVAALVARAHGDREGGAPLVVLVLGLAAVVALDLAGQRLVRLGLRRLPGRRARRRP